MPDVARIVELADNGTLSRVWSSLEPLSRTYLTLIGPGADLHWSAELHAPILDALRARDTAGTVAALAEHFGEVRDAMARRWPEDAPPPGASPTIEATTTATIHPVSA